MSKIYRFVTDITYNSYKYNRNRRCLPVRSPLVWSLVFLLFVCRSFLAFFPIHCMPLYFLYIVFTFIGCAWFPIYYFQTFKINSNGIRLITKYTLSTIIHTGVMVCWHRNIYHCSDLSIYFRIRLVNIFVLCCDSHSLSLFEFKYKAHPHLIVYQTDKSMLNQVRSN
jgi:hypothetical protein